MNKWIATAVAFSALALLPALVGADARADEVVTPLLKQEVEGTGAMEVNIARLEVTPGHETERHLHPGHVFLYVLEGEVEIAMEGREPHRLKAGEAGYELPNVAMVGRNVSSSEGAKLLVIQLGTAGEPMTVPQPN